MPRASKPARLWLFPERRDKDGSVIRHATWYVRDGEKKRSTGCREDDRRGAEAALARYLAEQHATEGEIEDKRAAETAIADVVAHYAKEKGSKVARPKDLSTRLQMLLEFWGEMTLDDVNRRTCAAYAAQRTSEQAARRELEDLRAAVNLYVKDGLCRETVRITVPRKAAPRQDHLTREQAAALIHHLWTARVAQGGKRTPVRALRHIVPFVLVALYTGTRSRRIWTASFKKTPGRPWIDVEGGVFYRAAQGEIVSETKRAGSIRIPERLLVHLRRWARQRDNLVEWQGRAANPKKALGRAFDDVFGEDHPFVIHSFRHTCATWLMWSGGNVDDIAHFLSMTRDVLLRVYGHHHPDAQREVGALFMRQAGRRKASR
ncbi:hypothetical protein SAMN06297251_10482 [Fulvimarina manganoxydans]|uniref:Phage integrase family protein n=1 Tax=Fulvimarina manganoxydans TaxID=937218 RepID=A0A1W2ACW3_9HYPH|nr:hypothetical protein [Fulvimarina manganoxydans]SMC58559.1 hypothetical protein SAMN06297251_10482 [Fulvimarina manganoxydans]